MYSTQHFWVLHRRTVVLFVHISALMICGVPVWFSRLIKVGIGLCVSKHECPEQGNEQTESDRSVTVSPLRSFLPKQTFAPLVFFKPSFHIFLSLGFAPSLLLPCTFISPFLACHHASVNTEPPGIPSFACRHIHAFLELHMHASLELPWGQVLSSLN